MLERPSGIDWVQLDTGTLAVEAVTAWATTPATGAVACFLGTVRDHSEGRDGVRGLTYEAYAGEAERRMHEIVTAARHQWPDIAHVALLHRTGGLSLGEISVIVVVSAPHRADAFDAARFCIDTLKEAVPIWKREHWAGGSDWAVCDHPVTTTRA